MAEHKVQLPDNSIIIVEGPADATEQELIDFAKQHYATKQTQSSNATPTASSMVDSAKHMDPLLFGGSAAALAGGALLGAKALKEKFFNADKPVDRIEPKMDVNQQKPTEPFMENESKTIKPTDWESSLSEEDRKLLERSRANAAAKNVQPTAANAPVAAPAVAPVVKAPVSGAMEPPVAAVAPVEPVAPVEVAPAETPKNTNEKILETINKVAPKAEATPVKSTLGEPDLMTGSGMPAYQGKGEEGGKLQHKKGVFESLKQIPKDYVFVPNGQNMDTVRNAVGQTEYTKNLKSSGGYPTSQQAAHEQSKSINQSLGRVSNAEAKAAGTFVEPTPSITQKVAGLKTVKVAGMTGALILATDLASAATTGESPLANMAQGFKEAVKNKDYGMAASQASELLNFHPYTMLANQLFGNSPEELQILRQADQAKKAGAGRGVAPPSAYQR